MAAETCKLDFLQWPRTPQHPTIFYILLRKTCLLLYDALRNNSSVPIHEDFWSVKGNWETDAAGCLYLFTGQPLTVLFLTEIIWLLCSHGPSLQPPFCLRQGFYFLSLKRLGQRKAKTSQNYRPITDHSAVLQPWANWSNTYLKLAIYKRLQINHEMNSHQHNFPESKSVIWLLSPTSFNTKLVAKRKAGKSRLDFSKPLNNIQPDCLAPAEQTGYEKTL